MSKLELKGSGTIDPAKETKCLHCVVWDAITEHSPAWPDQPSMKMYDPQVILGNLVDVMAEVIAGAGDRDTRRQLIRLTDERLRTQVSKCVAEGKHPDGKFVTEH